MATTYTAPEEYVLDAIKDTMHRYHQRLEAIGVRLSVLMAEQEENESGDVPPAILVNGHPALAQVRITPLRLRALQIGDAELIIDRYGWDLLHKTQRIALLDHQLTHLEAKTDRDGNLERDDLGRPKLKMRKHDIQVGAFLDVAQRHGKDALEVRAISDANDIFLQMQFEFPPLS